jgi:hypothetical protein
MLSSHDRNSLGARKLPWRLPIFSSSTRQDRASAVGTPVTRRPPHGPGRGRFACCHAWIRGPARGWFWRAGRRVTRGPPSRSAFQNHAPPTTGLDRHRQVLGLRWPRHALPLTSRVLLPGAPALPEALDVQAAGAGSTSGRLVGCRLGGAAPPGGRLAGCRAARVRRTGPGRAASCRPALPLVRGVPTRGVRCWRRRPRRLRRACPATVRCRRPCAASPPRLLGCGLRCA